MDENERVIIAGAGPTGLTASLALAAHDVPVTILEADPIERTRPGSRAIYVHGSSIRVLDKVRPGLGERIVDDGLTWSTRRTLWKGREVFSRTYSSAGGSGSIPRFVSMPQVVTEDIIMEACRDRGIDIEWDAAVDTVDSGKDEVRVVTEDGETYSGAYLIGADGGGSTVRKEIGVDLDGRKTDGGFIIADVDERPDDPLEKERVFHYRHPAVEGRNVLLAPFSGGWRTDYQLLDSDDPEEMQEEENVAELVGRTLGSEYEDRISWISYYEFNEVVAERFVDSTRRVLLAGDAAHLIPPFGARGMNSGIADSYEAGGAIAGALLADNEDLRRDKIELYAARREAAAEFNRSAAHQGLVFLQDYTPLIEAKKRLAAAIANYWEPAGEWLDDAPYGSHGSPPIISSQKY